MDSPEIRLPSSIYDPAVTRELLGGLSEITITEGSGYLRIRLTDSSEIDAPTPPRLREHLNQALRASIKAKVAALRPEDD